MFDLGFKSDDFDDESLKNYTKFNDFRNRIVYKFKSNSLDNNAIALINKSIISDISKKNIGDVNFANLFDEYVDLYKNGELNTGTSETVHWESLQKHKKYTFRVLEFLEFRKPL